MKDRSRSRSRKKSRSRSRSRRRDRSRSRSRRRDRSHSRRRDRRSRSRGGGKPKDDGFGRKCYVGNLDYHTDKHYLHEKFGKFGTIVDVFVPQDPTGRPRGFAFVTFEDARDAEVATKEMDNKELDNRVIQVNIARERPPLEQSRAYRERERHGGRRPATSRKIYVGNLGMDTKESELEDLFYKCGRITRVDVKQVSRPPGFAFVEFEDERDAEDAVRKFNGYKFDKEALRVELASSR